MATPKKPKAGYDAADPEEKPKFWNARKLLILCGSFGLAAILGAVWWERELTFQAEKNRLQNEINELKRKQEPLRVEVSKFHYLPHIISELGIAAFIASVIGIVVEFTVRKQEDEEHKRKLDAIQKNVFRYLFGQQVDEVISEQIMDMMKGRYMREDLKLSYYFRAADPPLKSKVETEAVPTSEILHTELTVSYLLANRSSSPIDAEIKHYFETLLPISGEHSCRFASFTVYEGDTKIIDLDMKDSKGQRIVRCESEDRGFRYGATIDRGTFKLDRSKPVKISYVYTTLRRWSDSETWLSTHPADGMNIEVTVDSTLAEKIEFYIDSSHAEAPKLVSGPSRHHYLWMLSKGVLPGHGIILCWKPKSLESVSGTGSAESNKLRQGISPSGNRAA